MLPAFHKEKHSQSLSVWHWLKLNLFVEILCFTSHRCSVGYLVYSIMGSRALRAASTQSVSASPSSAPFKMPYANPQVALDST